MDGMSAKRHIDRPKSGTVSVSPQVMKLSAKWYHIFYEQMIHMIGALLANPPKPQHDIQQSWYRKLGVNRKTLTTNS